MSFAEQETIQAPQPLDDAAMTTINELRSKMKKLLTIEAIRIKTDGTRTVAHCKKEYPNLKPKLTSREFQMAVVFIFPKSLCDDVITYACNQCTMYCCADDKSSKNISQTIAYIRTKLPKSTEWVGSCAAVYLWSALEFMCWKLLETAALGAKIITAKHIETALQTDIWKPVTGMHKIHILPTPIIMQKAPFEELVKNIWMTPYHRKIKYIEYIFTEHFIYALMVHTEKKVMELLAKANLMAQHAKRSVVDKTDIDMCLLFFGGDTSEYATKMNLKEFKRLSDKVGVIMTSDALKQIRKYTCWIVSETLSDTFAFSKYHKMRIVSTDHLQLALESRGEMLISEKIIRNNGEIQRDDEEDDEEGDDEYEEEEDERDEEEREIEYE
jgi:histone H3/H4